MSILSGITPIDNIVDYYADARFFIYQIEEEDIFKVTEKAIILTSEKGGACLPKSQLKYSEEKGALMVPEWLVRKNVILLDSI